MTAKPLDGKALAAALLAGLRTQTTGLKRPPVLAAVWMGDDASAASYRKGLAKACSAAGAVLIERGLPADAGEKTLLAEIGRLNADAAVDGILVQTPLPKDVALEAAASALDPAKDAEGIGAVSLGRTLKGDEASAPCTARSAFALVRASGMGLKGVEAVVVGRSETVGKPAALLLADAGCTVALCRSTTRDLAFHTRRAEVLVVAAGKAGLVRGDMLKPGAVVVDVGIHVVDGKVVGDVDAASAAGVAGWLAPVPGGVGPLTSAMIVERTVRSAARSALARR